MSDTLSADEEEAVAPPQPPRRKGRPGAPIGIGFAILATLIGLIVLAWAVLFVTKGRFLKHAFERTASRWTQRQVKVAGDFQLYFDPVNIKFVADGLSISNPAWASRPDLFRAKHIETRISTVPLIFGERHARWLNLVDAAVDTEWDAHHRRNTWTFGAGKAEPLKLPVIDRATATGSTLRYRDPRMQLSTDIAFGTIRSTGQDITQAVGFQGGGTLRSRRFTMNGRLLSPNTTVTLGRTKLLLHAESGGSVMDVSGTLPAATRLGGADLKMKVRGPNLRTLFDLLGVATPDTRAYRFTSDLTKDGGKWKFTHLAGHFGDSDLAGRMTISMPKDRLRIDADLTSRQVDIIDIGPFIGYEPHKLATVGPTAAATTHGGAPGRILPDAPLRIQSLSRFDAHVDYKVDHVRAPHWPISNIALTLDLDHDLLRLSPLTLDISGGHLSSDVTIDARGRAVRTDYDIRLSPTPMGRLFAGFGADQSGTTGTLTARARMSGTGDSVRKSLATSSGRIAVLIPAGTFWTRNVQLSELDIGVFLQKLLQHKLKKPVRINCGLVAFTVRDGIATADPILIDTNKDVMTAQGGFSFRDESIDLTFRSRAKTFSLFSGQSPVRVGGRFANPQLQVISPQLIARGVAGVALGVVASPIAAILAFVDPGTAPNTACGPVLAGASAAAQHTTKGKPVKGVTPKPKRR